MGSLEEVPEGDYVEAQPLTDPVSQIEEDEELGDSGRIFYRASFAEMENSYVNFDTAQWVLMSLLLILVYGVGVLLLLYIPIRRYVVRKDVRARKLYITSSAVVYKVMKPMFVPCVGVWKREKHVLLHSVTDVVIEQGCLQSSYGVSSIRIEGMAVHSRPPHSDDVRIQGISSPRLFKKALFNAIANSQTDQRSTGNDSMTVGTSDETHLYETLHDTAFQDKRLQRDGHSHNWAWTPSVAGLTSWQSTGFPVRELLRCDFLRVPGEAVLRKLDGIEASVKRLEVLVGSHQLIGAQFAPQASAPSGPALDKGQTGKPCRDA